MRQSSAAGWFSLALVAMTGCASERPASPTESPAAVSTRPAARFWEPPLVRPGLGNFAKVSPVLYRGEQPTAEGFRELEKLGVRTVVNLRDNHDDAPLLAGTNLRYVWHRSSAWSIDEADLDAFLRIVNDPANQPVFVHCQHGSDRTGFVVAGYRIREQNWDFASAEAELQEFGFHDIFANIPRRLRKLAVAETERLESVDSPPPPTPRTVVDRLQRS